MIETDEQRYMRRLKQNKGFWFASCPEMEEWAKKKVAEGVLHPLSDIVPNRKETDRWYVKSSITRTEQLLQYFSSYGLNDLFGIYDHNLDYQI